MSQENVETVRRWLAARSGSSEETLAAIAEFFDPDVDYYPVRKGKLIYLEYFWDHAEALEAVGLLE